MVITFECTSMSRNPAPPGQPPTYNFTWTAVTDEFGGTLNAVLTVSGAKEFPVGLFNTVRVDLGGVGNSKPAPAAQGTPATPARPRFGA